MSVSLGTMVAQLDGLRDTKELSGWENTFVTDILNKYLERKKDTRWMSDKQIETVQKIWNRAYT